MASPDIQEDYSTESFRTPGELAIKTVVTHLFAVANYAFLSTLQHRPVRTSLHALWVLLFTFVPTLIIVELAFSSTRALILFVRNQIDEEEKNVWFHLSAAVGFHASMPITNRATKEDEIHRVPLLKLDPTTTERERVGWHWGWAGKLLITLFALTQAVGTIIMYARRLHHSPLAIDHRNGAMGIASTICSSLSIFVLFLRFDWSVGRALQTTTADKLHASRTTLILHAFLAMGLHHFIAYSVNTHANDFLYTSTGIAFYMSGLFGRDEVNVLAGLRNFMAVLTVYLFREEIASKIGVHSSRYQGWFRYRSWLRVKALLQVCFVLWMLADIGKLLVDNIIDLLRRRSGWRDPISDKIIVI